MKPCPRCTTKWVDQACLSTDIRLPDTVRREVIAGLLARRHLILSGPSGLGKARLARALALCMAQGDASHVRLIQGHPWWAARTDDITRYVTMQTDYSLWRLVDFVESVEHARLLANQAIVAAQQSSSSSCPLDDGQEYVAYVEQMSPVEIDLYFDRFLCWLFWRERCGAAPIPMRLIGTYDGDGPPPISEHVQHLAALVHLDWTVLSEHDACFASKRALLDENSEKYLVTR